MNEKQLQIQSPARYHEETDDNCLSPKIFLKNTPQFQQYASEKRRILIDNTEFKFTEPNHEPLTLTNDECNYDSNITIDQKQKNMPASSDLGFNQKQQSMCRQNRKHLLMLKMNEKFNKKTHNFQDFKFHELPSFN